MRQLREFAALQGWTVYREFIDHETAKTDDRAEFQAMFRDASTRKFDVLLFWALDRLSREGVLETLQHLNRLTSYGYRSFTEQYFDSCGIFKDAVIAIVATVAKQERVRISERVKAGLETARAKGQRLGRPRVAVDARRIALLRKSGASWATVCQETGLSKGSARRALCNLPKNGRTFGQAAAVEGCTYCSHGSGSAAECAWQGQRFGRPRVSVDARRCDATGLSKGTAQRALHGLPKNDLRYVSAIAAD